MKDAMYTLIYSGTKLPKVSAGENCEQILNNIVKDNRTAHRLG